jgi:hypothetical protein
MHKITVPQDVTLLDPATDEPIKEQKPVTFKAFVLGAVLTDDRWRKDLDSIEIALKISKAVKFYALQPGDDVRLEDEDFKRLKECVEKPTNGYGMWASAMVIQLSPFLFAIKNAVKEEAEAKAA